MSPFKILLCTLPLSNTLAQELPNVLGTPPAKNKEEWTQIQRPKTLELFKKHVYGRAPIGEPKDLSFKVIEADPKAMNGAATLKIIEISYSGPGGKSSFKLITFIPKINKPKEPIKIKNFMIPQPRSVFAFTFDDQTTSVSLLTVFTD